MSRDENADDEFWDVVLEASWRHHMGEPVAEMAFPSEEAASAEVGEPGVLRAAGGWCAPFDPDRVARGKASVEPQVAAVVVDRPPVARLACGCPEAVLETGVHEPGCIVLDLPTATEDLS